MRAPSRKRPILLDPVRDLLHADIRNEPSYEFLLALLCVASVLAIMTVILALRPHHSSPSVDAVVPAVGSVQVREISNERLRAVVERNAAIFLEEMRKPELDE